MSVTDMQKLTVLCPQSDVTSLLTALSALSAVEIFKSDVSDEQAEPFPPLSASSEEARQAAARIDNLLPEFLARSKRSARRKRARIPVDAAEFARSGARERAMKTANEAERLLTYMNETKEKIATEQAEMAALLPYISHPYALDDEGTRTTTFLLGSLPVGTTAETLEKAAATTGFVYEVLTSDKTGVYLAVITHRSMKDEVQTALTALGFKPAVWQNNHGRATALFDAAGARAAMLCDELERANAQLDSLADNVTDIKILSDILRNEAELAAHCENMQKLGSCAILTAWCPTHECRRVTALLDELDAAYELTPPALGENVPTQTVTPPTQGKLAHIQNAYSYPRIQGKSTALPLQILLFLFFGFLFADAGYGILTALVFFPVARFLALETRAKHAFYTLACCGLGLIPFGVLSGNYFGTWLTALTGKTTLAPFPAFAAHLATARTWLAKPENFLLIALPLSALLLLLDLVTRLANLSRAGKPLDSVLSVLPELFTLTGLGLLIFYPFIGLGVTAFGLIVTALIVTHGNKGMRNKLVLYGGALLSLLVKFFEVLQAARIILVGFATIPVAYLIATLPLARGEILVWYFGFLLVFLFSHLLGILLNRIVYATRRARLAYMARHEVHYPAHEKIFSPMHATPRYTIPLSDYLAQGESQDAEEETDEAEPTPLTSTTQ